MDNEKKETPDGVRTGDDNKEEENEDELLKFIGGIGFFQVSTG